MPNSLPSLLLCCYYSSDVGSRGHAFGDNKRNFYSKASRYDQVTFGYIFYVTSADATPASGDHLGPLVEDNCDGSLENVKGGRIHTNLAGKHVEGGSSQKPGIIYWEKEERHNDSQQEAKREGVERMCNRTTTTQLILPNTALGSSSCDDIITWTEHNHDISYSWRIYWVCATRRVCGAELASAACRRLRFGPVCRGADSPRWPSPPPTAVSHWPTPKPPQFVFQFGRDVGTHAWTRPLWSAATARSPARDMTSSESDVDTKELCGEFIQLCN